MGPPDQRTRQPAHGIAVHLQMIRPATVVDDDDLDRGILAPGACQMSADRIQESGQPPALVQGRDHEADDHAISN